MSRDILWHLQTSTTIQVLCWLGTLLAISKCHGRSRDHSLPPQHILEEDVITELGFLLGVLWLTARAHPAYDSFVIVEAYLPAVPIKINHLLALCSEEMKTESSMVFCTSALTLHPQHSFFKIKLQDLRRLHALEYRAEVQWIWIMRLQYIHCLFKYCFFKLGLHV